MRAFTCERCRFITDDSAAPWDKLIATSACPNCGAPAVGIEERVQAVVRGVRVDDGPSSLGRFLLWVTIGATVLAIIYAPMLTPVPLIVVLWLVLKASLRR